MKVAELEAIPSPWLLSTHLPLALLPSAGHVGNGGGEPVPATTLGCRVVYLCLEPKDVVVSTWHYMNQVHHNFSVSLDRVAELFWFSIYGPIWEHYLGYWNLSVTEPESVLFLRYEEMMAEPVKHVKLLAEFLRVPFTDEEESAGVVEQVVRLCSFDNLRSLPVNSSRMSARFGGAPMANSSFFRAAKVGDWAHYLTPEMADKVDSITGDKVAGTSLTF
ncbi:hypothetical protein ACP4OV_029332 [Aristida adscensionis]